MTNVRIRTAVWLLLPCIARASATVTKLVCSLHAGVVRMLENPQLRDCILQNFDDVSLAAPYEEGLRCGSGSPHVVLLDTATVRQPLHGYKSCLTRMIVQERGSNGKFGQLATSPPEERFSHAGATIYRTSVVSLCPRVVSESSMPGIPICVGDPRDFPMSHFAARPWCLNRLDE